MSEAKKAGNGAYIAKLGLTLFAITAIAALALGLANMVTEGPIAEQAAQTKAESMKIVMSDDAGANTYTDVGFDVSLQGDLSGADGGVQSVAVVTDASGAQLGYCVDTEANGFGGAVEIMVGIDMNGAVTGISVLEQSETAGMGSNCTKADWQAQFVGVVAGFECKTKAEKKDGDGNIQAMTGSTITSKAVTRAANYALNLIANGGVQ